jgi:hypothetical protein
MSERRKLEQRQFTRYSTHVPIEVWHTKPTLKQKQFYRHPSDVPIKVWQEPESVHRKLQLNNVSLGGVAFQSDICWKPNTIIHLRVLVEHPIELAGKVVWCRQNGKRFDVGVEFIEANSDSEDMVEQVRHIEMYKKMMTHITEDIHYDSWEHI